MTHPDPPQENKPRSISSQQTLEFIVVFVLILMVLISLWALFWPTIRTNLGLDRLGQTDVTATPGTPQYEVVEEGTYAEIAGTEVISYTNCAQAVEVTEVITRTRTIEHRILIEGDLTTGNPERFMESLEEFYGFKHGEMQEEIIEIPMLAESGTRAERTVSWQYIWKEGEVKFTGRDGEQTFYPYRARTGTAWETVSEKSEQVPCAP